MKCDKCKKDFSKIEKIHRIVDPVQPKQAGLYAYPIGQKMLYVCGDCEATLAVHVTLTRK